MATVLATIDIKRGCEARFETIARRLYEASHAQESALIRYEYWRGEDEGRYYCLLAFDDHRGFMVHQTSDYHETEVAALREVMANFRFEWVDPVAGAAPLGPTEPSPPPLAPSDIEQRYRAALPLTIHDWWARLRAQRV